MFAWRRGASATARLSGGRRGPAGRAAEWFERPGCRRGRSHLDVGAASHRRHALLDHHARGRPGGLGTATGTHLLIGTRQCAGKASAASTASDVRLHVPPVSDGALALASPTCRAGIRSAPLTTASGASHGGRLRCPDQARDHDAPAHDDTLRHADRRARLPALLACRGDDARRRAGRRRRQCPQLLHRPRHRRPDGSHAQSRGRGRPGQPGRGAGIWHDADASPRCWCSESSSTGPPPRSPWPEISSTCSSTRNGSSARPHTTSSSAAPPAPRRRSSAGRR